MNIYTPRLEIPKNNNKYYITKSRGGYSNAIEGKCESTGKPHKYLNTLANCVSFSYGRFNEIGNYGCCRYLSPVNAENFIEYAKGCTVGQTPKLGACMVWQKGATKKGSDGAGHVAIVEEIISPTEIVISQSGYNNKEFWTETIKFNKNWNCNWMGNDYKFLGFIYNPAVTDDTKPILKCGNKNIFVRELQEKLNEISVEEIAVDGSFGNATLAAVKAFQKEQKLKVDGIVGEATWEALLKTYEAEKIPSGSAKLIVSINGTKKKCASLLLNGEYYIRSKDLVKLGLAKSVTWNMAKKLTEMKTK